MIFCTRGFLASLIDAKNSETHKSGSNMADQNAKSGLIRMKFGTQGILGSLIRIRVWNSEIKHGGPKCKITSFGWNSVFGGLWVTDYKSELKIQKFKMADPIWRQKIQEMTWFDETRYSGNSTFKNEKWRIQYGVQKYKRWINWEKNRFLRSPIPN